MITGIGPKESREKSTEEQFSPVRIAARLRRIEKRTGGEAVEPVSMAT